MERRLFEEMVRRLGEERKPGDGLDAMERYEVDVCMRYSEMRRARERRGMDVAASPLKARRFDALVERAVPALEALGVHVDARRNPLHGRIRMTGERLRLNSDAPKAAREAMAELLAAADDQIMLPVQTAEGDQIYWECWFDLCEETRKS